MYKPIMLCIGLMVMSCGPKPVVNLGEFEPYVEEFIEAGKERGVSIALTSLIIEYGDTYAYGDNSIGVCITGFNKPNTVLINKVEWEYADECYRKALIFHELGHCILDRDHVYDRDSLLEESIRIDYCGRETYYLDEMFGGYND